MFNKKLKEVKMFTWTTHNLSVTSTQEYTDILYYDFEPTLTVCSTCTHTLTSITTHIHSYCTTHTIVVFVQKKSYQLSIK